MSETVAFAYSSVLLALQTISCYPWFQDEHSCSASVGCTSLQCQFFNYISNTYM